MHILILLKFALPFCKFEPRRAKCTHQFSHSSNLINCFQFQIWNFWPNTIFEIELSIAPYKRHCHRRSSRVLGWLWSPWVKTDEMLLQFLWIDVFFSLNYHWRFKNKMTVKCDMFNMKMKQFKCSSNIFRFIHPIWLNKFQWF